MTARRRATQAIGDTAHLQDAAVLYNNDSASASGYYPLRVGEIVEIAHLPRERLEVVAIDDSALVTLRHARCGVLRVGWRYVRRLEWL